MIPSLDQLSQLNKLMQPRQQSANPTVAKPIQVIFTIAAINVDPTSGTNTLTLKPVQGTFINDPTRTLNPSAWPALTLTTLSTLALGDQLQARGHAFNRPQSAVHEAGAAAAVDEFAIVVRPTTLQINHSPVEPKQPSTAQVAAQPQATTALSRVQVEQLMPGLSPKPVFELPETRAINLKQVWNHWTQQTQIQQLQQHLELIELSKRFLQPGNPNSTLAKSLTLAESQLPTEHQIQRLSSSEHLQASAAQSYRRTALFASNATATQPIDPQIVLETWQTLQQAYLRANTNALSKPLTNLLHLLQATPMQTGLGLLQQQLNRIWPDYAEVTARMQTLLASSSESLNSPISTQLEPSPSPRIAVNNTATQLVRFFGYLPDLEQDSSAPLLLDPNLAITTKNQSKLLALALYTNIMQLEADLPRHNNHQLETLWFRFDLAAEQHPHQQVIGCKASLCRSEQPQSTAAQIKLHFQSETLGDIDFVLDFEAGLQSPCANLSIWHQRLGLNATFEQIWPSLRKHLARANLAIEHFGVHLKQTQAQNPASIYASPFNNGIVDEWI